MMTGLAIFVFFFSILNFLVCAYVLHQILKCYEIMKYFTESASMYIASYAQVSSAFAETKSVVNSNATTLNGIIERLNAHGAPLEGTVTPRKRSRRVRTPVDKLEG